MRSLYITSVEKYSGKTALCLALGKIYQSKNNYDEGIAVYKGLLEVEKDNQEALKAIVDLQNEKLKSKAP